MAFTKKEKEALKYLIKKELKGFKGEKKTITDPQAGFLAMEEKYDVFLKNLLKKFA